MNIPSDAHVLITGGAGFIGSNLAGFLLEHGVRVTVLDNLLTGRLENLEEYMANDNFRFIKGDIRDFDVCKDAMKGVTHVTHQAALGSVPRSIDDPILSLEINISGTINIFQAANVMGIKRVVFASSSSVYGSDEQLPKVESQIGEVLSPYAASKRSMEVIQQAFVRSYPIEIVGLRYFNVFGPKQDPNGPYAAVIPKFIQAMKLGEIPTIFGDGEQSRDFTYISNVINGNCLAMFTEDISQVNGKVVNLAFGSSISVNDLFFTIRDEVSKSFPECSTITPTYEPPRKGDILHSHADISMISTSLGFNPEVTFLDGIQRTVGYYLNE